MQRFLTHAARAVLAAFTVVAIGATTAAAEEFSEAQKAEINAMIEQYVRENPQFIRNYLLQNPEILLDVSNLLRAKQAEQQRLAREEALTAHRDRIERHPMTPVTGNPEGDVTVVEFFDYNCPYCKRVLAQMRELEKEDPDLRLVWKEFPILGPVSTFASRVAMAADRQGKYMEFHNAAMGGPRLVSEEQVLKIAAGVGLDMEQLRKDLADPAIEQYLNETIELANALGITGTPGFIIGDEIISGAIGKDQMRKVIQVTRQNGS